MASGVFSTGSFTTGTNPAPGGVFRSRALVVLATGTFNAFFFSQTRYRIPVEPQLLVLAALGVMTFVKSGKDRTAELSRNA